MWWCQFEDNASSHTNPTRAGRRTFHAGRGGDERQNIRTMIIFLSGASTGWRRRRRGGRRGRRRRKEGLGLYVIRLDFCSDPTSHFPSEKIKRERRRESGWGTSGPSHHYEVFDSQTSGGKQARCPTDCELALRLIRQADLSLPQWPAMKHRIPSAADTLLSFHSSIILCSNRLHPSLPPSATVTCCSASRV